MFMKHLTDYKSHYPMLHCIHAKYWQKA